MEKVSSVSNTKDIIEKYDFSFKKKFGQNFLVDKNVLSNIVSNASITKDSIVIEIGPGIGALTQFLCDEAEFVYAFEIDNTLIPILEETLAGYDNKLITEGDFLKIDLEKFYSDNQLGRTAEVVVVANLPYYITTPIISKLIESGLKIDRMIMMMQKEVAERLSAKPKTKDYNSLSIFIQYYMDVKILMNVNKNVFIPKPNVDSAVIELSRKKTRDIEVVDEEQFFTLVKDGFNQRRKTLRNNWKKYDLKRIESAMTELGLHLGQRAEEISINDYIKLVNLLNE